MPGWTQGLLARMIAGFLIIAIPIAIILSAALTAEAARSLTAETQDSVSNLAIGAALRMNTWLDARQDDMLWAAELLPANPSNGSDPIVQRITTKLTDEFDSLAAFDASGKALFTWGAADTNPTAEDWFQQSLKQPMITPIRVRSNVVVWSVTAPVPADVKSQAAVVIGDLRVDRLSAVLTDFGLAGDNEVHVVDPNHKLVYSSTWGSIADDATLIGKGLLRQSETNPAVDAALGGQSGVIRTSDYRNTDVIAGYAPVQGVGWALIATEPTSVALAPVNNQVAASAVAAAVAVVIAIVVAVLMARSFARPITAVSGASERVVEGDLSTRVAPRGAREVRQLGERFNTMIEQLEHLVVGLRELSSRATASATRLATAADELASATTEQTSAATETSASMEELSRTSTSIADTLQRVSVQAQETRENLEQAQSDMQASGTRTLALAERVNDVNEILTIINDIADQTNLLALNAAIEAARAGESGRGFAVVADEVRRLAERSKSSAGKISKIIESARSESNATVMAMEQSTKQMERGLKLLEDVVDASSHVQVITQQQRSATDQVLQAMEQIAAGSRQVSNTAQEISKAAAGHAGLAVEMETMSRNGTGKR